MTIAQIAARIQTSIDHRELPWPIHASAGAGEFITLEVRVRNPRTGRESAESTSFPRPLDLVRMDGLQVSIDKMITKANQATHIGLEVF